MSSEQIHTSLQATSVMLRHAFPNGISEPDYFPLIKILSRKLSEEQIADVVDALVPQPYMQIWWDANQVEDKVIGTQDIFAVEMLLQTHGYESWKMREHQTRDYLPSYLLDTGRMLNCAYPDGIPETDYRPLITLLRVNMSHNHLDYVLFTVTKKTLTEVERDTYFYDQEIPALLEDINRVRKRLAACGYDEWLEKA